METASGTAAAPPWFGLGSRPYPLLVLTTLFWAGNAIAGRAVHQQMGPLAMTYWRWVVALAIYFPFAARPMWNQRAALLRGWRIMLVLSFLGVPLFHGLFFAALAQTTAINVTLVNATMPLVMIATSWALFRDPTTGWQGAGVLLSLAGVGVVVTRADPHLAASLGFNAGDLLALAAMPVWALYSVLLRRRPAGVGPQALLGTTFLVGVVMLTPVYLLVPDTRPTIPGWDVYGAALFMGLFPAVLAYQFWNRAVELIGPNRAGHFIHLVPLFAAVMAVGLLGETLHGYHLAGAALIAGGILLGTVLGRPKKAGG